MKNQKYTNQILTSSDHHANWTALEELFKIANQKNIPLNNFIVNFFSFSTENSKSDFNLSKK